jgi:hypothetical protein
MSPLLPILPSDDLLDRAGKLSSTAKPRLHQRALNCGLRWSLRLLKTSP